MLYIAEHIQKDVQKEMVFVGGPRQVGKTTMARSILDRAIAGGRYISWGYDGDRQDILDKRWHEHDRLLVFDELYEYPRWKSWLKGIYDVSHEKHSFLVTGSARLDLYGRGGHFQLIDIQRVAILISKYFGSFLRKLFHYPFPGHRHKLASGMNDVPVSFTCPVEIPDSVSILYVVTIGIQIR